MKNKRLWNRYCQYILENSCVGDFKWKFIAKILNERGKSYGIPLKLLERNKQFKNIHNGERCFILGNGPSLNLIDFTLLNDECVFTTNLITKHKDFDNLRTNYHVISDMGLYGLDQVDVDVKKNIHALKRLKTDVPFFTTLSAYDIVKKFKLQISYDVYYFSLLDCAQGIKQIDLCNRILSCTSVVQIAVQIALYMGFSEIYLLGCDGTTIKYILDYAVNGEMKAHYHAFFEDDAASNLKKTLSKWGLKREFLREYRNLDTYEMLNDYCKMHNILFKNLTPITVIDNVERDTLENILKNC